MYAYILNMLFKNDTLLKSSSKKLSCLPLVQNLAEKNVEVVFQLGKKKSSSIFKQIEVD